MSWRSALLALAAGALAFAGAAEGAHSERPIVIIVPFDAGGGNDVVARMLAPLIEKHLGSGTKVEVVNRPGAGGEFGFAEIADAPPDGHTIGFIATPNVVTIPIERQARHTLDRLDPLIGIVDDPDVWVVRADSPFMTVADVVAHARLHPASVSLGSSGIGSDDHLALLRMQQLTKTRFVHVPFTGAAASQTALLANKITIAGENLGEGLRTRAIHPVRILGVMSASRWEIAKDIPTFKEQGFDVVMGSMRGIAAPKGLPPDVRARLIEGLTKAATDPDFVAQAATPDFYQPLRLMDADAFTRELWVHDRDFRMVWKENPWIR